MARSFREIVELVRSRAAALSPRGRVVVAVAAGAVALTLGWLLLAAGGPDFAAVDTVGLSDIELAAARGMLAEKQIPATISAGRLLVDRESLPQAREIVSGIRRGAGEAVGEMFSALAEDDNIWRTAEQDEKRWQAAKMAALGKLVEAFPSVASATVIYDAGKGRRLGQARRDPAAAVNVRMKAGAVLTRSLAQAIADQVSGSISGMAGRNVRVIDAAGQSFSFDAPADQADGPIARRRAMEEHYQEKLRVALAYIDKIVVGVSLGDSGEADEPIVVTLAVPRSYLAAVSGAVAAEAPDGEDGVPRPADRVLADVRQAAAAFIGDRPCRIQAQWYYDVPDPGEAQIAPTPPAKAGGWLAKTMAIAAIAAGAGGAAAWGAARYRRRRNRGAALAPEASADSAQTSTPATGESAAGDDGLFAFLDALSAEDIASLISLEHPQTIAIVLAQLEAAKAAAVLAALTAQAQAAVATRMAGLDKIDPVVMAEVARSLAERAESRGRDDAASTGQARMAQILRHTGYATEKTVLAALAGQSPALAEAVRRHMFTFDDMAQLPPERLRAAMASVDSSELAVALRTAGEEVKQNVLSAMAPAAAKRVRAEMDRIGPVRLTEVEAAQQHVAEAVRRAESGEYLPVSQRSERQLLA